MTDTWQPIETAPKGGVRVLLYFPDLRDPVQIGEHHVDVTIRNGVEIRRSESWVTGAFMILKSEPTHWMPAPAPPVDGEAA